MAKTKEYKQRLYPIVDGMWKVIFLDGHHNKVKLVNIYNGRELIIAKTTYSRVKDGRLAVSKIVQAQHDMKEKTGSEKRVGVSYSYYKIKKTY